MPPPINTATQPAGYPPQQIGGGYGQGTAPPGYPPGGGYGGAYAPAGGAPQGAYGRPGGLASEMDAGGRSKAQLIVGIDFVSEVIPSGLWYADA